MWYRVNPRRFFLNARLRNTDDHLRNHAFIGDAAGWRLSPVFDVVPTTGGRRHALGPAPGLSPEWNVATARAAAAAFGLSRHAGDEVVAAVEDAVRQLPAFLDARQVVKPERDLVLAALDLEDAVRPMAAPRSTPFVATLAASTPAAHRRAGRIGLLVDAATMVEALSTNAGTGVEASALRALMPVIAQPEYAPVSSATTGVVLSGRAGLEHLVANIQTASGVFARLFLDIRRADDLIRGDTDLMVGLEALLTAHGRLAGRGSGGPSELGETDVGQGR